MANFEGESCSKCGKAFQPNDSIVVCPDCGAPYHRECIKEMKECVYHAQHGTDQAYKPKAERDNEQFEKERQRVDGRGELRCSRCGTMNPADGLFCEVCGTPLKKQIDAQYEQNQNTGANRKTGPWQSYGQNEQPYHSIPYNPFTTPFGGLNPDEEIQGIPVKDLAIYLGQNSHYFIPRFKQMQEKNSNTWNWAACLLEQYYLLFRRINWLGILMFIASLLISVPGLCSYYDAFRQMYSPDAQPVFNSNTLLFASSVFSFISVGLRVFMGMFTNRIYMNQVFKDIRKIKQQYGETPEYHSMLLKNGSVSIKGVVIILCVTVALSILSTFLILFFML